MLTLGYILAFIAVYGLHYWWAVWIAGTFVCWMVVLPWLFGPYSTALQELVIGILWPIVLAAVIAFALVRWVIDRLLACRAYFAGRRENANIIRVDPFRNGGGGTMI
jgi:hypothetical protein